MRFTTITLTCLCIVMTTALVLAEDKKPAPDMNAMMDAYKQLATPGEPHKQLASMAGSWTTTTKEWMDPSKPPMESKGTCEEKVVLDGRFLQQECRGEMMGQPFAGIGMIGYDNLTKKYVTTWMSSMGTGIFLMEGTGSPDGKVITLNGSHPDPFQGVMKHRAIWKLVDPNTQTFEMHGAYGDDKETKMMEITYTRKK